MLKNNLKLALRNLLKRKYHSLINILGLSFGIACSIVVYLYVQHETSFNKFHENKDYVYKLNYHFKTINWGDLTSSLNNSKVVDQIKEDIPAVEKITGYRNDMNWIRNKEKRFHESVGFADESFFEIFSFDFLAGDNKTALNELNNVVITESVAKKFYGDTISDYSILLDSIIELPQKKNKFKVSGIIKDVPTYSTLQFDIIVHFDNAKYYAQSNNAFGNTAIYMQISKTANWTEVQNALNKQVGKYYGEILQSLVQYGYMEDKEDIFSFELQSLVDIYFKSKDFGNYQIDGDKNSVYILGMIAFLILLIACVNYIMLSIGNSMNRMKEIGVLKIVGARRKQIMRNFIAEALVLTLISMFFGLVLAEQILPEFNRMAQKKLAYSIYDKGENYIFLSSIILLIVLSSSIYMSVFLLKHKQPLQILKFKNLFGNRFRFARTFVIMQYFITISLLVTTGLIIKQIKYMQQKDVGFEDENVVVVSTPFYQSRIMQLKNSLSQYPEIINVSTSDRNFVWGSSSTPTEKEDGEKVELRMIRIDNDYINTLDIELVEGRNFEKDNIGDSLSIIVNQSLVKELDIKNPIGHTLRLGLDNEATVAKIIGVVKDYHYDALTEEIKPLFLYNKLAWNSNTAMFIKIGAENKKLALSKIEKAWNEVLPDFDYSYSFLSENLDNQYKMEEKWSKLTSYAAIIAIFLSCLGLIGLTSLMVSKKTKEIGIRKVNGAGTKEIVYMLNKTYLKWVLFAFAISIPVSYYVVNKWLEGFAYRTEISWWIFAIAGIAAAFIALITVSYQCWSAARRNPVESLRFE